MKKLPLRGKHAAQYPYVLVDDEDYNLLNQRKWYAFRTATGRTTYAVSSGPNGSQYMHRVIMAKELAASPLKRPVVDHLSNDGLDNRRSNLKVRTQGENVCRQRLRRDNSTGYRGVSLQAKTGKYRAGIKFQQVWQYLGTFETPQEAFAVWCERAKELFGDAMPEIETISVSFSGSMA